MDYDSQLDHDAARARMAAAIEGSLDVEQERELAVHLVGCADCKALYSRLQQAEVALRGLAFSHPPSKALEAAITRATTVLRGEADPGPSSRAPGVPPPAHLPLGEEVDIAPSPGAFMEPAAAPIPIPAPISVEPAPVIFGPVVTGPGDEPEDDEPRFVRAIFSEPDETPVAAAIIPPPTEVEAPAAHVEVEPDDESDLLESPGASPPRLEADTPAAIHGDMQPPALPDLEDELTDDDLVLPPLPPPPGAVDFDVPPRDPSDAMGSFRPADEVVSFRPVLEDEAEPIAAEPGDIETVRHAPESPTPAPRRARPAAGARRRGGAGGWLAAITAAVVIALVAGFVFTRNQTGGGSAPTAAQVRERVQSRFAELRSLKASYTIRRLDLYPVSRNGAAMQYSFSDGTTTGRLVFDRSGGFREESATSVSNTEIGTTRVAQTVGELRTLQGTGTAAKLVVVHNPPLGPPDGNFYPALGSLDRAIGSVAQLLVNASGLEVLGLRKTPERQVVDVRFDVVPTELSRADRIQVTLDARTYFPVHIRREISRANGRVLAPESILGGTALQTAFGNRDRILTEDTVISDLVVDDVILPGDFVLDVPQGVATQNSSGSFQRVTHAGLASKLHFTPLFPQSLPNGSGEQALAVFTGKPGPWGPNRSYPAPDGILHATYFDGKTTIVVTERHMPKGPFALHGSPITGGTLPMQVSQRSQAEKTFFYASSPEIPPHAFGFLGDVFVMAVGNATADELVGIVASMGPAAGTAAAPLSPATSPGASATP